METAQSSRTNLAIYKAQRPWAYLPTSKPSPRLGWRQFWEGHLCRPDHLSSIPGSQEVARKNQLLGTVFRPPAMCCGTHNLTFTKVLFLQRTLVNTAPRPLRRFHLHPSSSDSLDTGHSHSHFSRRHKGFLPSEDFLLTVPFSWNTRPGLCIASNSSPFTTSKLPTLDYCGNSIMVYLLPSLPPKSPFF